MVVLVNNSPKLLLVIRMAPAKLTIQLFSIIINIYSYLFISFVKLAYTGVNFYQLVPKHINQAAIQTASLNVSDYDALSRGIHFFLFRS